MREFLDQIGPHWFPVELDAKLVVDREIGNVRSPEACLSTRFAKDFFSFVTRPSVYAPGSCKIIICDANIFNLGAIFEWMQPQRDSLAEGKLDLDAALISKIDGYRTKFERDPRWLDEHFPALTFYDPAMPGLFTYANLIRGLIQDAKAHRLKRGDGVDFCHAVIGTAFARAATLDKHWKRRVDALPKPNNLARIYYRPQLDQLVLDVEAVSRLQARDAGMQMA
jgi:hypothetical protein